MYFNDKPSIFPAHCEIALLVFVMYALAFLLAYHFGADVKGVDQVLSQVKLGLYLTVVLVSIFAFLLPMLLIRGRWKIIPVVANKKNFVFLNCIFLVVYFLLKIKLLGGLTAAEYAFDSGEIEDPTWKASIFLSECIYVFAAIWVFIGSREWFLTNIIALQMNLMHGTRIYVMIAFISLFYVFFRHLSKVKILITSIFGLTGLILFSYIIFLFRHGVLDQFDTDVQWLLSPVLIESVFSQWSLINVLGETKYFGEINTLHFILDPILYTVPRFLLPDKDLLMLYFSPDLSPLGAFNGVAASIVYLGVFFPLYWFLFGLLGALIYQLARRSLFFRIYYFIFCTNIILRLMRDGYLIPTKIIINDFMLLAVIFILVKTFRYFKSLVVVKFVNA